MKINQKKVTVKELTTNFIDSVEEGVFAYDEKLTVRPAYQREFVYKDKQRDAVIDTIIKQCPLGIMYWKKNSDDSWEVVDGQQRIISICKYVTGYFSINNRYFHNLTDDEKEQILNYELIIFECEGSDTETLEWFRRINIAGEKLTDQELLNANYTGPWLAEAKKKFSKPDCVAARKSKNYLKGNSIRQEYLEIALSWINNGNVQEYMAKHQFDTNANELWLYFNGVIDWVETTFNTEKYYRKEMCGVQWGLLYNKYKDNSYDAEELESKISELMANEEVTDKKGIYEYVLSGCDESLARKLSKRTFTKTDIRSKYEQQKGICPVCGEHFKISEMEADHIVPWHKGGATVLDNLQMLCKKCNKEKGGMI